MSLNLTTLPNGLRIITDHVPDMHSVALGVWCDVGTRYEDMRLNGIAHLVEHMMFKGTSTRSASKIAEDIENVGGQMNAFTSRELTAYYIHLLKQDVSLGLDVISDIMTNSLFPEDELEKERQVILQEIGMTLDTPDDQIFDLYQSTAYPGQALGAPILGTAEIVANMAHKELKLYTNTFYTPSNIVISAAGAVDHSAFVKDVGERFNHLKIANHTPKAPAANYKGGEVHLEKELEQAHVVLGFQGVGRKDTNYETIILLSTILGGGMSSRLFQEIREKRGLVYSVYSHHTPYRDDGQFEIYAGTGPERLGEIMPVICDELKKMQNNLVSDTELSRAKSQVLAAMLMSRESMLARTNRQAKHLLTFGSIPDIEKATQRINQVTCEDIRTLAGTLFSAQPTLAALGPLKNLTSLHDVRMRLMA